VDPSQSLLWSAADVKVVPFHSDTNPDCRDLFINQASTEGSGVPDPADLGYLAGYAAGALAPGIITDAEGETFEAGRLGEYTIGADGVVLLGDPGDGHQRWTES
jgi:hypothetical protein